MTRIIACVDPDALPTLFGSDAAVDLREFINFVTPTEIFDRMWVDDRRFDFVIVDGSDVDCDDLSVATENHPDTRFIVFDPPSTSAVRGQNLTIVSSMDGLRQALCR